MPATVGDLLTDHQLVRIVTLRGTIHLHTPDDARGSDRSCRACSTTRCGATASSSTIWSASTSVRSSRSPSRSWRPSPGRGASCEQRSPTRSPTTIPPRWRVVPQPDPPDPDPTARGVGQEARGHADDARGVDRPGGGTRPRSDRCAAPLPGGLRPRLPRRHRHLVRGCPRCARPSTRSGPASGCSSTTPAKRSSTSPTRLALPRTRRPRSGTCPSTTTSCSRTTTARASWPPTNPSSCRPTAPSRAPCSPTARWSPPGRSMPPVHPTAVSAHRRPSHRAQQEGALGGGVRGSPLPALPPGRRRVRRGPTARGVGLTPLLEEFPSAPVISGVARTSLFDAAR